MEPELLQPTNPSSFAWVSLICSRRGGSTAAVLALDTAVEESRKKMADRVARSPARLCSKDGKLCCCRRLEYDVLAFLPCFLHFSSSLSLSRNDSLLRVASSVQQSSAPLQQVRVLLVSVVFCLISRFPFFGSLYFSYHVVIVFFFGVFVVLSCPVR